MVDSPPITTAMPSAAAPLVDRYRNISPVWYPFLEKLAKYSEGIANGNLIVDGAITARTLSADAIDADAIAADILVAGFITADSGYLAEAAVTSAAIANAAITSAQIGDAAVDTLQIAGNAVTQATTASSPTQFGFSSTSYTSLLSMSMTLSGNQPLAVWGTLTVGGATSVAAPGDYFYEGLYWQNNILDGQLSIYADVNGTSSNVIYTTILAGQAVGVPFVFLFTGLSAGTKTIRIYGKVDSGGTCGIRDMSMVGLEAKR